jgi:D-alanyl-D-alanine carboxypeptidase
MGADESAASFFANDGRAAPGAPTLPSRAASITSEAMASRPYFQPVPIYVGRAPGWTGPVLGARGGAPASNALLARTNPGAAEPVAKPEKPGARKQKVVTREIEERAKPGAKSKPGVKSRKLVEQKPRNKAR